jgi:fatty-acid desaturase
MDPDNQLDRLNEARTQYHWAIANIAIALLCVLLAGTVFVLGYIVAGALIIVVSVVLAVNAESHWRRGDIFAREAQRRSQP